MMDFTHQECQTIIKRYFPRGKVNCKSKDYGWRHKVDLTLVYISVSVHDRPKYCKKGSVTVALMHNDEILWKYNGNMRAGLCDGLQAAQETLLGLAAGILQITGDPGTNPPVFPLTEVEGTIKSGTSTSYQVEFNGLTFEKYLKTINPCVELPLDEPENNGKEILDLLTSMGL